MAGVLYVSYDGLLEPLGASQVLPYVRALRERGFAMEVLSFEKPDDLRDRARVEALRTSLVTAGIPWTPLPYHRRPTLPATAWDVRAGRRWVEAWARRTPGRGLLHARGYVAGLLGVRARELGHRLLFDMRGFWVDERVEAGYWPEGGARARVARWIERTVLRAADHLVLLTRRAVDRLPDLAAGPAPPWTVVPTCADLDRFRPASDAGAARRSLGLGTGPVVVHTGTLTGWYDGPATVALGRAFQERTGGAFVVLTRDVDDARELASAAGATPVIRTASHADVPAWLAAADAGLALVRPSPAKDASFPTKVGEYLAAGLAVVGTPVGDMADLADPAVVRLVDPGCSDPDDTAAWLDTAVARPDRSARARALAEAHLGLTEGVDRLAALYRSLGVAPTGGPA